MRSSPSWGGRTVVSGAGPSGSRPAAAFTVGGRF
ncbi:hypothetical protein Ae406Ps2_1307c [Pseudonocardia sp. Ae406_Ps2]|nr:hypothetical protein Ae406Ps2_1307c [Pseudonocardia sp. Ae406_Ps2]OLM06897.1 hypothetical protein Ae331Ps2_4607 [Pseudonocardia sp. Ae331_Ps2]OLM14819.1 hypothetical protein Ae505Ps2_4951c [Pseudonocardia sp. Ae505_Ps2]OLM22879.1 hypothetical protein Ae706Ps2_1311c [Pseudonocardia sp. Ae706_Ps2]